MFAYLPGVHFILKITEFLFDCCCHYCHYWCYCCNIFKENFEKRLYSVPGCPNWANILLILTLFFEENLHIDHYYTVSLIPLLDQYRSKFPRQNVFEHFHSHYLSSGADSKVVCIVTMNALEKHLIFHIQMNKISFHIHFCREKYLY